MMGAVRRDAHRTWTGLRGTSTGFTLIEMLVVIAIAVVLMGLLVPTGRALRAGNRAMTCKSQLQQIGVALKAYTLDEGGAPPFYIDETGDPTDPAGSPPTGPGLMALYETGYLGREQSLHCPVDNYTQPGSAEYFYSYQRYDPDVSADVALNGYSYLSTRGITLDTDPLYRRQLQPAADIDGESSTPPMPVNMPGWRPGDEAIITWCPFHVNEIEIEEEGAYQVLFWDGSGQRVRFSVMTDSSVGPDAAWKVGFAEAG